MALDTNTVEWIIGKLKDSWDEYGDCPASSTLSIGNCHHRVFLEQDLVKWLARSMHSCYKDFLPKIKSSTDLQSLPTHMVVRCECGEFEAVEEVTPDTLYDVEYILLGKAEAHVAAATRYLLADYEHGE